MKYIVVFLILFSGFSGVRAQDAYEQFRTEMKKLETREREYHSVIFGKNDYPEHYKDSIVELYQAIRQEKREFAQRAVDNNRLDKRFVKVLGIYVQNYLTLDELEADLKKFSPEVQKEQEWKDKMDFVKYSRLNQPGQKCIDFTVKGHDGKEIRLSDLLAKNKLVLIDFWASWCGACRATMPHLKDIYPEYKKKGVEFFSVSLDDKEEDRKKAFKEEALPWIDGSNLLGWKDPVAKQYAITGIPFKILIGKDGIIVDKGFARFGSLEKTMDDYLDNLK